MFCENCGKSLIRGYQFCLECGTPVPAQSAEDDEVVEQNAPDASAPADEGMPQVGGSGGEGGTLVFCPTCGMHMQKSGAYCEKCGMQLQSNSNDQYNNLPKNGSVPLWNTESEDYGYASLNDGEIEQINKFMSGGGITAADDDYEPVDAVESFGGMDAIGGASEIEAITNQFANMYPSANTEMPAIGGTIKENGVGERMMDNFAMESTNVDDAYIENGHLPIIEGASMEYDPNEPEPEDPNAFVMTEEAIEDITPTYNDLPAYTEPEEEVFEYEDSSADALEFAAVGAAVAASAYEPETAEEAPAYEEPAAYEPEAAEEAPAYEEPAADEPEAVEEAPAEDMGYAIPVYSDDGDTAEENYINNDSGYDASAVTDIPLFADESEEEKNDTAVYAAAGVAAAAAISEIPEFTEPESIPTFDEPEAVEPAPAPVFDEPAPARNEPEPVDDTNDDLGGGFMAAAAVSAAPRSAPKPSDALDDKPEVDLGRLIYCRNCGQDMYEKELVCQNCGAPKRPEYVRPTLRETKKKSEPFKLFGVIGIPALVAICAAIALMAIIILPSLTADKSEMTSKPSTTTASTTSTTASTPEELDAGGTEPAVTTTTPVEATKPDDEPVEDTKPEVTTTASSSATSSSATTPVTTPTSASSSSSATTTKPTSATTTTAATVSTPAVQSGSYSSATVISQNKERDALINAYETLAGEIGKVDVFARNTVYAIAFDGRAADTAAKSFYSSAFGSAAIKSLSGGKSTVSAAISAAKPTSGELNKAYNALKELEDIYLEYCNFVTSATSFSRFESTCAGYMGDFENYAKKNFSFSALNTSAQTSADRTLYYADIVTEASNSIDNAVAAYSTLNGKIGKLTESTFSGKFYDTMASNISTYMKAAKYTYAVKGYIYILGNDKSYSGAAYITLSTACKDADELLDVFCLAAYDNTLANFKSTVNSYVSSLTSKASYIRTVA